VYRTGTQGSTLCSGGLPGFMPKRGDELVRGGILSARRSPRDEDRCDGRQTGGFNGSCGADQGIRSRFCRVAAILTSELGSAEKKRVAGGPAPILPPRHTSNQDGGSSRGAQRKAGLMLLLVAMGAGAAAGRRSRDNDHNAAAMRDGWPARRLAGIENSEIDSRCGPDYSGISIDRSRCPRSRRGSRPTWFSRHATRKRYGCSGSICGLWQLL